MKAEKKLIALSPFIRRINIQKKRATEIKEQI